MKDRILRISSMLLVLWYCFSVIGFDVHTCNASGRSFIATVLSGMTCEEIHPSHHCSEDHCCASHVSCCCHHDTQKQPADFSYENDSCCSDEYIALSLTGNTDNAQRHINIESILSAALLPAYDCSSTVISGISADYMPYVHCGPGVFRDYQSLLNVWRI